MAQQSDLRQEHWNSRGAACGRTADQKPRDLASESANRAGRALPPPAANAASGAIDAVADARAALARVEQSGELGAATLARIRSVLFTLEEIVTDAGAAESPAAALESATVAGPPQPPSEESGRAGEGGTRAEGHVNAPPQSTNPADLVALINSLPADARPHWDRRHRVLTLGPVTIKKFRHPARNQERLLNAFEEHGWPEQIDDPSPGPESLTGVRLNDTIRQLNRHQQTPLLRFGANGKANGVRWWIRKAR